jgi:hypothetical protein
VLRSLVSEERTVVAIDQAPGVSVKRTFRVPQLSMVACALCMVVYADGYVERDGDRGIPGIPIPRSEPRYCRCPKIVWILYGLVWIACAEQVRGGRDDTK